MNGGVSSPFHISRQQSECVQHCQLLDLCGEKAADIQDYSAPVSFSPYAIARGGAYVFILSAYLVQLMLDAFHHSPYPSSDGEIAGFLPMCEGSPFVPFCTEYVMRTAWANQNYRSQWHWTPSYHPTLQDSLQPTFDRMKYYMSNLTIFSEEIPYVHSEAAITLIYS